MSAAAARRFAASMAEDAARHERSERLRAQREACRLAREALICRGRGCDEQMRKPTEDGLCGFCREELTLGLSTTFGKQEA